jgi:transposase
MKTQSKRFSAEVRERAVRMVFDHRGDHATQWAAIQSIAGKIGCNAETLRLWVRRSERDAGLRAGATSQEQARIKALEREVGELRQANEILRKASAYFAAAEPTADRRHDRVYRRSPRRPRGRADLQGVADRTVRRSIPAPAGNARGT